ncbi:helix-turn-helix domain-containing protein (plasmid) [Ampullimonas aquatilis]|uniref:helix-turn-helix domain-containing protein n=1 Tax=Ampullimonas aquatilis TaxID=1341549 RepID=UPI003C73C2F7
MDKAAQAKALGERLRLERKRLGFTQDSLAARVGMRQHTIYQYENGYTSPSTLFLYTLHELGFNVLFILLGREHVPKPSDFAPDVLRYVADAVDHIEKQLSDGPLSSETKLRMMLILLGQYVERPNTTPLTDLQSLELLIRN